MPGRRLTGGGAGNDEQARRRIGFIGQQDAAPHGGARGEATLPGGGSRRAPARLGADSRRPGGTVERDDRDGQRGDTRGLPEAERMSAVAERRKKAAAAARAKELPGRRLRAVQARRDAADARGLVPPPADRATRPRSSSSSATARPTSAGSGSSSGPASRSATTTFFFGGVLALQYGERPALIFISFSQAAWILFERSFHWGMRSVRMTRALSKGLHLPRSLAAWRPRAPAVVDFSIHSICRVRDGRVLLDQDGPELPRAAPAVVDRVRRPPLLLCFGPGDRV